MSVIKLSGKLLTLKLSKGWSEFIEQICQWFHLFFLVSILFLNLFWWFNFINILLLWFFIRTPLKDPKELKIVDGKIKDLVAIAEWEKYKNEVKKDVLR